MSIPPYFDPLGETEPNTTVYTLTVLCPPRPPPRWVPKIFTRIPIPYKRSNGATFSIRPSDYNHRNPNYDCFELRHLKDMKQMTVKVTSSLFLPEMRCAHVQNGSKTCDKGCYVLEKGGKIARWMCKRVGCEGHVYCGRVKENEHKIACFGRKGQRMVCLERS